jgi:glucose/mannose-6-phosphate isomerase
VTRQAGVVDDPIEIARRDPHRVRDELRRFPEQCREALRLRADPALSTSAPQLVVVAGMGGSAVSGDLLAAALADRASVPMLTHRGYGLPPGVGASTLVVVSSYSGETVEAISALEAAVKAGAVAAVTTTGGRLGALAALHRIPTVRLPGGTMPRLALGYLFFPLLGIARAAGLPTPREAEVTEAIDLLDAMSSELAPEQATPGNEAKRLASEVGDRIPVVYGGQLTASVAYRWKTDVEENAKRFAVAGAVPEMNHNEIEAWRAPDVARLHAILLRDSAELADIGRRFAAVRAMVVAIAGSVSDVRARGDGRLARLLSLVCLGQWTSYYLALRSGVDPWAVPMLHEVKRRIAATTADA